MGRVNATKLKNDLLIIKDSFDPWLPLSSKNQKNLVNQTGLFISNCWNSLHIIDNEYASSDMKIRNIATFNIPPIYKSLINLIHSYTVIGTNSKIFTRALISSEVPKLVNPSVLILNFRKSRFFPALTNLKGRLFATMSLGMFSKFFNKGKSFIKNKSVFLLIAGFLRKLILFSEIQGAMLQIKRVPLYFKEILSALHDPVVSFYKNFHLLGLL